MTDGCQSYGLTNNSSFILITLCPAGKILSDDSALKEYKIDEKNFVVVMVAKVRRYAY